MHTPPSFTYGLGSTPFGMGLIGWNEQGINMLHLQHPPCTVSLENNISKKVNCSPSRDDQHAGVLLMQIFESHLLSVRQPVHGVALSGSPFQLKVWQGLRKIPFGQVCTYGALAERLGHPGASRAVGSAIATNQIAFLVPCHRVIRATGETGQFRWGHALKVQMLHWESQQLADSRADR